LGDCELLSCRERNSPTRAALCSEAGVVTTAEGLDRAVGLLDLGHRFRQTSPHGPAYILPALFARLFQLAVESVNISK